MERFGCTPVQMGSYLAVGNAMHIPAGFIWAALGTRLLHIDLSWMPLAYPRGIQVDYTELIAASQNRGS